MGTGGAAVARARGVDAGVCGGREFARTDDVARAHDVARAGNVARPGLRQGRRGRAAPLAADRERSRRLVARRFSAEPGARLRPPRRPRGRAQRPLARRDGAPRPAARRLLVGARVVSIRQRVGGGRPVGAAGSRARSIRRGTPRAHLALALGLGFGGIVEGRTSRPDVDPLPDTIQTSYTFPSASPPLPSCSGVGAAALARAEWTFVLGPRTATSLGLEAVGQWTGCVARHRARRARHRAGDRAPPVLAARRRPPARGASRGAEARADAASALAAATLALLAQRARAADAPPASDAGAPDAASTRRATALRTPRRPAGRRRRAAPTPARSSSRRAALGRHAGPVPGRRARRSASRCR